MNTFILISGWLFWILAMALAVLGLGAILLDRWITYKDTRDLALQSIAYRRIGSNIYASSHWLHGEEYKDIPPYVLMKTLGEHIERTGGLSIERLRNVELPEALEQYHKDYMAVKKDLHIVD